MESGRRTIRSGPEANQSEKPDTDRVSPSFYVGWLVAMYRTYVIPLLYWY